MKTLSALLLLPAALPAAALEQHCETYLRAVEKTAAQPARHSVSDLGDGMRSEAVIKDGQMHLRVNGRWRKGPTDFAKLEAQLHADLRSGKIKLFACRKLGRETVGGVSTTVYSYQLHLPGVPVAEGAAKAYIGDDGLIHAQAADGVMVQNQFSKVTQPKY